MLLKAGTYRFNDVLNINGLPIDDVEENRINFTSNGVEYVGFCAGGNDGRIALSYIDSEEVVTLAYFIGELFGQTFNGWIYDYFKDHTLPTDQTVDDTFGTWYIANTNYNEVNPTVDTIYTEKSSWYKSVADAIRNKKGTSEPILRDNFASEIESISVGADVPEYDGAVIIEKAESVLGLRRFKETATSIGVIDQNSLQEFYLNNAFKIEAITSDEMSVNEITPVVTLNDVDIMIFGNDGTIIEGTPYSNWLTMLNLMGLSGVNILSTPNSTVDEWLLANTEGVSV